MDARDAVPLEIEPFGNPELLASKLRDSGPVHKVTLPDGMPAWLVTGNQEVRQALSDPNLVRSIEAASPDLHKYLGLASSDFVLTRHMLFADPPDHTRMRKVVSKAFTPRRIERLRPRIQEITDELLEPVLPLGEADLVAALALPLPIAVICELLGVPYADREEFEQYAETITGINASSTHEEVIAAGQWFDKYTTQLVESRRRRPGDDLISAMLAAMDEEARLTDLELRSNVFLLLAAGFETTVNLIANGLLALLRHPEAMAVVRDDRRLLHTAIEEILRYDSPVSSITYRFAAAPVKIGDVEIPAGDHVALSPPMANYDPAKVSRPAEFDITRSPNPHVSFGHGIHFCIGAPLARLEGEVAFGTVLDRMPGLALAVPPEKLTWKPSFIVHRLDSLPVTFDPARR
ncbi:cytochrome P450 family protein [Thermoactinospora rubra]|uniref:cytochrome P450 family protein n=1 Tax=Thermoactinospora rubra TaxID=1088767 RepID=UPI000A117F04|nr:cytochrome P450 [Thermoactinospora rubra]